MSNKTAKTLFILSPFSSEYAGLYQELLSGVATYQQYSMGNGDQDKAKRLFELIIDTAPDAYNVKSVLSLGALAFNKMDFDTALYFYQEPIKAGKLSAASLHAIRAISHLKSIEGSHYHAVKDLESILPLIKHLPSHSYFDFLHSYAVELGAVGRKYEARNISRFVIKSPFAFAYPEWQETANELKEPNRSLVVFKPFKYISRKVLPMPEREHEAETKQENQPARVISLQKWKRKMTKKKDDKKEPKDEKEMIMWIMDVYVNKETTDDLRHKIYEAVRKVVTESDNPEPDDDGLEGA